MTTVLFACAHNAGLSQMAAALLVATCVANALNLEAYLADVLTRVQSHPNSRLDELLPVAWKRLRAADTS
jgi:transposase